MPHPLRLSFALILSAALGGACHSQVDPPATAGEEVPAPEVQAGAGQRSALAQEDPQTRRWRELSARADDRSWSAEALDVFVAGLPKVETHVHLDGALSPATIKALAVAQRYAPLQDLTLEQIAARSVVDTPKADLAEVLEAFFVIYPLLRRPEAIETIAYEYVASAAAQNTRYVEVRFAPALQAVPEQGFTIERVIEAALAGLARGREAFGVESAVIICLFRAMSVEANDEMVEAAIAFKDRGVVGIDLAGDEAKDPLRKFTGLYAKAKAAGLFTTVHAGEVPGGEDLALAIELGVDRIGHAKQLEGAPALLDQVVAKGIGLEVNLTSNYRTAAISAISEHPAKRWFDAGATISVSTDDPGVFGVTLGSETRLLVDELGFTPGQLIEVQRRAISSLFLPEADKRRIAGRALQDIEELLARP